MSTIFSLLPGVQTVLVEWKTIRLIKMRYLVFPEHILFVIYGRFSLYRASKANGHHGATFKCPFVINGNWGRMFILTDFAFVKNRHFLPLFGDKKGL
jgi:hypothetical protein